MTESRGIVVCAFGGGADGLPEETEGGLTLGRRVGAALGVELSLLVVGPMPDGSIETAGKYGAATVDRVQDAKLDGFRPDAFVEALAQYLSQHPAKMLRFSQTH